MVKNPSASERDIRGTGSVPGSGRSPEGEGHENPQHSCLENPMDSGAWWATVHGVTKSQAWLKRLNRHTCILVLGSSLYTKVFDFTVYIFFFFFPSQVRETSSFSPTFWLEKLFLLGKEGVEMQERLVCCGCWNRCIISPITRHPWRGYTVFNAHVCNLDSLESY